MIIDPTLKIATLFIPVRGFNLALPTATIAELVHLAIIEPVSRDYNWLYGQIKWCEENVAIISFESIQTQIKRTSPKKPLVAILKIANPTENTQSHLGIIVHDIPRIIQATPNNLTNNLKPSHIHPYALCYVTLNNHPAIIPDLRKLKKFVDTLLNVS